jgi:hypothetical protein
MLAVNNAVTVLLEFRAHLTGALFLSLALDEHS